MNEEVKKIILEALKKAVKAVKERDVTTLKDLSNYTIHSASTTQDEDSISSAVLMYSLFKIYERSDYEDLKSWQLFNHNAEIYLQNAYNYLNRNDIEKYRKAIKEFLDSVDKLDKKLKNYIEDVLESAKISKGSRLYEHGLSMGRTAELFGVSQFELMDYVGKTGIANVTPSIINIKKRLEKARSIFK